MIRSYLRLAASLIFVMGLGWVTLKGILANSGHSQSKVDVLAHSFTLGLVVVVGWSVALVAFRVPLCLAAVLPVTAVPVCLLLIRRGMRRAGRMSIGNRRPRHGFACSSLLPVRVILLVLAVTVTAIFVGSMHEPIAEIDAVAGWGLHAKVFYHERTTFAEFLTSGASGSSVTNWRPLFPLIQVWGHLAMGTYDDHKIKLVFPFIYLSLLGIVYGTMAKYLSRTYSLAVLLILATVPALVVHYPSGSVASGLADVTFALLLAGATGSLVLWVDSRNAERLMLAAIFSASAVWTKREGLAFAGISVVVVWGFWYLLRQRRPVPGRLQPLLFTLANVLSVFLLARHMSRFPGPWVGPHLELGKILSTGSSVRGLECMRYMIFEAANPCKWGFLWILFVLLVVLRAKYLRRHAIALPVLLLAAQLGCALLFMIVSSFTVTHHRHLDMRRVLVHVAPIATLVIGFLSSASGTGADKHTDVSDMTDVLSRS